MPEASPGAAPLRRSARGRQLCVLQTSALDHWHNGVPTTIKAAPCSGARRADFGGLADQPAFVTRDVPSTAPRGVERLHGRRSARRPAPRSRSRSRHARPPRPARARSARRRRATPAGGARVAVPADVNDRRARGRAGAGRGGDDRRRFGRRAGPAEAVRAIGLVGAVHVGVEQQLAGGVELREVGLDSPQPMKIAAVGQQLHVALAAGGQRRAGARTGRAPCRSWPSR